MSQECRDAGEGLGLSREHGQLQGQGERAPQRSGQREKGGSGHRVSWEQRKKGLREVGIGASLVVQWLRLHIYKCSDQILPGRWRQKLREVIRRAG